MYRVGRREPPRAAPTTTANEGDGLVTRPGPLYQCLALRAAAEPSDLLDLDAPVTHALLDEAVLSFIPGFFHATRSQNFHSILSHGLQPVKRPGSMHSLFPPWDRARASAMQRWEGGLQYDLVLVLLTPTERSVLYRDEDRVST